MFVFFLVGISRCLVPLRGIPSTAQAQAQCVCSDYCLVVGTVSFSSLNKGWEPLLQGKYWAGSEAY